MDVTIKSPQVAVLFQLNAGMLETVTQNSSKQGGTNPLVALYQNTPTLNLNYIILCLTGSQRSFTQYMFNRIISE